MTGCASATGRIGGAVFEVTQPRVTCYRVGIRMDDPQMPALLVSRHRPGFYFRVLAEGAVQPGDEIIKVTSGPEAMTVAQTDALLYLPGHPRQQLRRALRIPALSAGWKASFTEMPGQPGHRPATRARPRRARRRPGPGSGSSPGPQSAGRARR
jgi:MOSC domain-containing protein YiiM